MAVFDSKLTEDEAKRKWIESKHDITDVLNLTSEAKSRYDGKGDSKAFEWLLKFSYRIQYYHGHGLELLNFKYNTPP